MSHQHPPSPVPADQDLWPGELPFTEWGQHPHGILDLRVFDQNIWWVDITQQPHRIEEMSDAYVANVIGFLHRHRFYYYLATLRRSLIEMVGDALLGQANTDVLAEHVGVPPLCGLSPSTWLESTPLMRTLQAHASGGPVHRRSNR